MLHSMVINNPPSPKTETQRRLITVVSASAPVASARAVTVVVERLACFKNPESDAGGMFRPLVGFTWPVGSQLI